MMLSNPAARAQPAQRAARIPEVDTILPYKSRATKRAKAEPNLEFLKAVPDQYHPTILAQMAEERAVHPTPRTRGAAVASTGAVYGAKQERVDGAPAVVPKDGDADDDADDDDDGDDERSTKNR